ncbi:MAG: ATP-binding protein [Magnetococcus sp. XQGC-1]
MAGVGKSTFAARSPKPVFIITEDGLGLLQVTSFPQARTFVEVLEALDSLLNEPHDFETVVLDSLDWLEPLIWAEVCRANRVKEGVLLPEVVVVAPRIIVPKKPKVIVPDKPRKSSWLGDLRDRWQDGRRR